MKRIISTLTTAIMLRTLAQEKNRAVTENDSLRDPRRVIELKDAMIDGKSIVDTLSIMTYENSAHRHTESDNDYRSHNDAYDFDRNTGHSTRETIIAIVAIVSIFDLPLVVVFIIFFPRYKNREARYRLVEQALASGQPLPEYLSKNTESVDTRNKGIRNMSAGVGPFTSLWAVIGGLELGYTGLPIIFIDFGQVVICYMQQHKAPQSNGQPNNTKTGFPRKNEEK